MLNILLNSHPLPSNLPFLFAAFAVTWIIFFAYAFFVSRRRQEVQREVAELQRGLEQQKSISEVSAGDESAPG